MLDEKYERYWDELDDIGDEWQKLLESEHDEYRKSVNTYYRHTRSIDTMSEELLYKLCGKKFQNNLENEMTDETELIKGVSLKKIRSAIESLSEKQKIVLELYIFHEYNQDKIAEIMGITQSTISITMSRALANIAKQLNK